MGWRVLFLKDDRRRHYKDKYRRDLPELRSNRRGQYNNGIGMDVNEGGGGGGSGRRLVYIPKAHLAQNPAAPPAAGFLAVQQPAAGGGLFGAAPAAAPAAGGLFGAT